MIVCSKEEPVKNNESLYQREGINDGLILDQSAGFNVNRYCFVFKNEDIDTELPILLNLLISHLNVKIYIILCWLIQIPEKSIVASKVIKNRYENKYWYIFQRDSHYIAIKEISNINIIRWPPAEVAPLDGGVVLLLGDYTQKDMLAILNDKDSMFLAKNKYFVPDADFLLRLERNKIIALYQANDELNNMGLVLVGGRTVDLEFISKNIAINQIFEGESAYKIFVEN